MDIAILLYEGFSALDAVGPYEAFARLPGFRVRFVAREAGPVRCDTGMLNLVASSSLAEAPPPEMLIIPGGPGTFTVLDDQEQLGWVAEAHRASRWTLTVCSGSLILGATGALQGLTATTHWVVRDQLPRFGAIYVAERYVQHGKLFTAAGGSAGIDAALQIIALATNEQLARAVQLGLEYDPKPPFDSGSFLQATPELIALVNSLGGPPEAELSPQARPA
jgi:transcriptional regulator GlxA family with amidase domain